MKTVKDVETNIGGVRYLLTTDDAYLDPMQRDFEPPMVALFKALATGSETILDIGANIGCTALLFGRLAKMVYAFEPSKSTFAFLEQNVARSGQKNIVLANFGLGAEPGEYTLTFSPSNRAGAFVSNQTQASVGHDVEAITIRQLDEVVSAFNLPAVDFVKIDVEGFEGHVLRGAQRTLTTFRPTVVLELNHWCLNAFQRTSVPDFFDFLRSIFPILYAVDNLNYLDLHDPSESYIVMYNHIVKMRFPNIVAAFDVPKLREFPATYRHEFIG